MPPRWGCDQYFFDLYPRAMPDGTVIWTSPSGATYVTTPGSALLFPSVEVYLADPDDPVLGRRLCAAADCDRSRSENGLCSGHGQRWRDRDRPAMAVFLVDPGPALNGAGI